MLDVRPFKRTTASTSPNLRSAPPTSRWRREPSRMPSLSPRSRRRAFPEGAKLLVADFDGEVCQQAADLLHDAGFTAVVAVQGGYSGWRKVFTTCGRRRPPQGKWVSTGKEALKSGLDLDPNVAAAYEENWGKEPPKHGGGGQGRGRGQGGGRRRAGEGFRIGRRDGDGERRRGDRRGRGRVQDEEDVQDQPRREQDGRWTCSRRRRARRKSATMTTCGTPMGEAPITGNGGRRSRGGEQLGALHGRRATKALLSQQEDGSDAVGGAQEVSGAAAGGSRLSRRVTGSRRPSVDESYTHPSTLPYTESPSSIIITTARSV